MGPIAICPRRGVKNYLTQDMEDGIVLKKEHWIPRCLGHYEQVRTTITQNLGFTGSHEREFSDILSKVKILFSEPIDYVISRYIKGERKLRLK